jgi:hypothetical protein
VEEHIRKGCKLDNKPMYKNQCSLKGCKKRELMPIQCKTCRMSYCISHRLEQDHSCIGPPKSRLIASGMSSSKSSLNSFSSKPQKETCLVC